MSTLTLYLSCHCRQFTHRITLPTSSLPLKSSICHCETCRRVSGQLFATFAVIPLPSQEALPSTDGLTEYKREAITNWFCERCGATCWGLDPTVGEDDKWEWEIATGVVREVRIDGGLRQEGLDGLLDRVQMWVGDTRDGGAAIWINDGKLEGMDRRVEGRDSRVVSDEELAEMLEKGRKAAKTGSVGSSGDSLRAHCACGKIDMHISRRKDGQGYTGGLDACESCRLVSGFEINCWTGVPIECLTMSDGSRLDLESKLWGHYESSAGVYRFFCKGCGAAVFYHKDGDDELDICVGLLDAAEGARADSWLTWTRYHRMDQLAYREDAIDKTFVHRLAAGCQSKIP